ncbi:MAG TPA: hypothetical protein VMU95_40710 [Trebonia sp.]|nr:hypothetical protein [Trebonia sp.]
MALMVVVHGVGQQLEGELTLHDRYFSALRQGVARAGGVVDPGDVAFVSYGEFFRPAAEVLSPAPYFDAESVEDGYESKLLLALWRRAASVDSHVVPPDEEVLARSPVWASRALAALSRSAYFAGVADRLLVGNLKQVHSYFADAALRARIRQAVADQITDDTRVVVAHSLGTVVAYEVLCSAPGLASLTFVTLGSPLGLPNLIFDRLQPAPRPPGANVRGRWPARARSWTNVADAGDVVALVEDLRPLFGGDLRQIRVHNGAHAHDMASYLTERLTGDAIAAGLNDG